MSKVAGNQIEHESLTERRFWYVPETLSDAHCEMQQLIRTEAICSTVPGCALHRWEYVETGVRMREQKSANGFDHIKSSLYVKIPNIISVFVLISTYLDFFH